MSKSKTAIIKIADLKQNLFVRKELNHDHAFYLGQLIENGVTLPPIEITRDLVVIDGRHRIAGYELNNVKEIEAEVVEVTNEVDLIAKAYKGNVGGSLPPTPQDTEHTVTLLLERGEPKKHIAELLGLPAGMARKYINDVQSKLVRAKLQRAAMAITEGGLTLPVAAERYDVEADKLKEVMSGHRRKHKQGVVEIRRMITKLSKSTSSKVASLLRKVLEKYEDGDLSAKQVADIFTHVEHVQKLAGRSVADWKRRFEALNNGHGHKAKSA